MAEFHSAMHEIILTSYIEKHVGPGANQFN